MIKRFADRFLEWYCHPDYYPDISGDLEELYLRNLEKRSGIYAKWRFFGQVLLLFRPSLIKPIRETTYLNDTGMLKNYFKIGVRNLNRNRSYTFINVFGLAVGLAAFLLINEYIKFERSYDTFFEDPDQLHRVTTDQVIDGVLGTRDAMTFYQSGKVLVEEIPEVIDYTTTYKMRVGLTFKQGERTTNEKLVIAADSSFLDLFTYRLLQGHPEDQLKEPNTIVITESVARKYFGETSPVGKQVHVFSGFDRPFKITGVIEDTPENTHYKFDVLMSLSTLQKEMEADGWNGYNYYVYVKLAPNSDLEKINKLLPGLMAKYNGEGTTLVFNLQPIRDIHLYSDQTYEPETHGDARSVNFLIIISVFVLAIAWVNYINLATARSIDRAKEVGLRKVIGAFRLQLLTQFLMEAVLINLLGMVLALVMVEALIPFFNQLVQKEVMTHTWEHPDFVKNLLLFGLFGVLISGFYPALVLSNFKPVTVLKGKFRNSRSGVLLRKGLVVTQFATSFILIAGTMIIYLQVKHMRSLDVGINTAQVIGFPNPRANSDEERETNHEKIQSFLEEVNQHASVIGVAQTSNLPGGGSADINASSGGVKIVGLTERFVGTTYIHGYDHRAIDLLDMELIQGRNYIKDLASDSNATIVNEAFIHRFGLQVSDDLLNREIQFGKDPENDKYKIIGIVKDMHRSTTKNVVEPTAYFSWEGMRQSMIKLSPQNIPGALEHVQSTWLRFFPAAHFDYSFLDDRYDQLYKNDQQFGKVFSVFSIFAILVASLGLFGLAAFIAIQRTKEVGVRKVLGAGVHQIVGIFYKDFLVLILISVFIGVPLVFYAIEVWLDSYANRISFPWVVIPVAIAILMMFAFLTVGYQTFRVAILNPAKTLKYE